MKKIRRLQMIKGKKPTVNLPLKEVVESAGWKDKENLVVDFNEKKKQFTISKLE